MDQAEQLCDFVCIIAQGRKVLDGPLKDIRRAHAGHRYRVSFDEDTPAVAMLMTGNGALAGGSRVSSSAWDLDLPTRSHVERAMSTLASADVPVTRFEHVTPSLHQIFVEKVGNAGTAARRPEAGDA
jgi:ABC-2 type transport system ATP-binding protein